MNRGTLPIVSRLQALQGPLRIAPGGGRVIAAITDQNPLAALLQEVNETMLGRSLTFESSGGASLTLDVSGRRVLRVSQATGLAGAGASLAIDALEDEHKDELIKLVQAVATPRHELRVTSVPMDRDTEGVSVGLPIALLADLLLVDLNALAPGESVAEPERPEPPRVREPRPVEPVVADQVSDPPAPSATNVSLRQFVQAVQPQLMAWLILGDEEGDVTEGPEEMVQHLQGFLEDEGEALAGQLDQVSEVANAPVCIVLGATLADGHNILCARSQEAMMLAVVEGDATLLLLQGWSAALRA